MKAVLRGSVPALAVAALLTTALSGCDGSSSARSTASAAASRSASTPSAGGSTNGSAPAASGSSTGAVASGGSTRPRSGAATSSTRSQAEVPVAAPDSCKITSSTAVVKAFGGSVVTAASGTSGTGASTCHYVLARTRNGAGLVLDLSLTRHVSRSVFDGVKKQSGNQSVAGVGQDAYYRSSTKALQIYVRGSVAAMQATPTRTIGAAARTALRARQIVLGKSIAAQS